MPAFTDALEGGLFSGLRYVGAVGYLFLDSLYFIFAAPFGRRQLKIRPKPVFEQMARVGFSSLGIVCLVMFSIGIVIALQMAYILKKFGVSAYVGSVVGVSMFRELGPMLTAVVMSGYAGAAIAAELGTMSVSEEIEALRASAIDPVRFLVVPRLIATTVMVPCVTMIGDFVGILGGMGTAYAVLKISPSLFIQKMIELLVVKDILTGMSKSVIFAALIALIACFEGLSVESGAEGVGRATTRSVVLGIVMIIFADTAFTALFYTLLEG